VRSPVTLILQNCLFDPIRFGNSTVTPSIEKYLQSKWCVDEAILTALVILLFMDICSSKLSLSGVELPGTWFHIESGGTCCFCCHCLSPCDLHLPFFHSRNNPFVLPFFHSENNPFVLFFPLYFPFLFFVCARARVELSL